MSERKSRGIRVHVGGRILALAALVALVLALAGSSRAQSPSTASKSAPASTSTLANAATVNTAPGTQAATPKPAAEPAAPAQAAEAAKPGNDGIKIHGHWVLEVKNPDGKLVERREFDNSLVTGAPGTGGAPWPTGEQLMAALLSGNATAGDPAIVFVSQVPGGAPRIRWTPAAEGRIMLSAIILPRVRRASSRQAFAASAANLAPLNLVSALRRTSVRW